MWLKIIYVFSKIRRTSKKYYQKFNKYYERFKSVNSFSSVEEYMSYNLEISIKAEKEQVRGKDDFKKEPMWKHEVEMTKTKDEYFSQ